MSSQPLSRVESQDPHMPALRQRIIYSILLWSGIIIIVVLTTGLIGLALAPMAAGWVIIDAVYKMQHHTQVENFLHYRQLEALASLHALIKFRQPLPPLRLWAISPDFATLLAGTILRYKPYSIVELGSGASTLISAYCLEQLGTGQVTSFDHIEQFASQTRQLLSEHRLSEFTQVIHAPLRDFVLPEGSTISWYNTEVIAELDRIDLLIVDGPPGDASKGKMPRYPAIPALYNMLSDDALILVDDYMRPAEQAMVNLWLEQYDLTVVQCVANEKGAVILQKYNKPAKTSASAKLTSTNG